MTAETTPHPEACDCLDTCVTPDALTWLEHLCEDPT